MSEKMLVTQALDERDLLVKKISDKIDKASFVDTIKPNEDRKEVIRLLGGVISGMNVGQPLIMQAANSEAQEPTEDVMDDADVAGLAMGWMSKGD